MIGGATRGPAGRLPDDVVVFGSGEFVPATTGDPFPDSWKQGGLAYASDQAEKAALPIHAPIGWDTVYIYALVYAENFGSGTVRFKGGGADTEGTVDLTVTAAGLFLLWSDVPFTDAASLGLQIATMPLTRVVAGVTGNLAEDACVLRVFCSPRVL